MVWIAVIIGVILLFIFPKQMGILIGVVVLGIAGVYLYLEADENDRKKQNEAVSVNVRFDTSMCSEAYPIAVNIKNGSRKIVEKVRWNIGAYAPGHSNNLVDYGYGREYGTPYESDNILNSGQGHGVCYQAPKLKNGAVANAVNWSVTKKSIVFNAN